MKILLVEDNKKLSDSIKEGLEQEGFAVDCLYDGATAERRISINRDEYDLVILDRMLPGKEGVEVCLAWRRADITVPVIMLTALDTTGDKVFGLDAGAEQKILQRVPAQNAMHEHAERMALKINPVIADAETVQNLAVAFQLAEFP